MAAAASALSGGAAERAARADADDWQLSARAGLASVVMDGRDPLGVGLGGELQYGFDDAWALRLSLGGAAQRVSSDMSKQLPGGTIWSYSAFAGVGYTMDVLRLLPTFAAGIGVLGARGAVKTDHTNIGIQVGLGADYLLTPRFSLGATAEYVFAPFDLFSHVLTGDQVPQAFALQARATWTLR
jgi:opacity protein-like surface antigen